METTADANSNNQNQTTSSIDVTKEKDGGVLKTILKTGIEPGIYPAKGDTVFVHYSGVLKDTREKFDSSRDRGDQPFSFSLGQGQVIKAWDLAVATMCNGEIARIECRSDYAYGASGSPPKIPPNSTLIFEVELLRFEGEDLSPDRDSSITKSIVVAGEKANYPSEHAPIKVHAVGSDLNGRVFYDRELEYVLGEGLEQQLPEGVDKALRRINKGEKCRVTLKVPFNYGTQPPAEFGLAPNEPIIFTLFLKEFEKTKASWELMDNEKLEQALKLKERGTDFLNKGKFKLANSKYNAIVSLLEFAKPTFTEDKKSSEELEEKFKQTLVAACLNSALANIKMGEMGEAIKCCEKVLEKMPDNVKAMYRKAQALQQRKDYEEAIKAYKRVQEIEPENKAAAQQIHECRQQINIMLERERKKYRGMFNRLAKENENDQQNGNGEENKKE